VTVRLASLFHDIHRLASRYHWAERDILALAWPRRRRYLAIIEAEAAEALFEDLGGG
jgi:hypothetical protein